MKLKICSSCGKECYLWKSIPKLCKECAMKDATPIGNYKMSTKSLIEQAGEHIQSIEESKQKIRAIISASKPRSPINSKSDKQKKIDAAYRVLRGQYMKDHPKCMFKDCQSHSEECHHIRGRSKEYMLDTREWMAVCKIHHDWIHANDKEARELGYLKSRLGN